jgi:DNA-binding MarR family transcriptional regulator
MDEKARNLYFSLKSIFLHIDCQEKGLLARFDLTVPRFFILMHVNNHPGLNAIELSELMLCTKGNISRVVRAMQRENLLTRQPNTTDQRSFNLFLTEKGSDLFKEVNAAYTKHIDGLLAKLPEDQLATYSAVSDHLEQVFKPKE